MPGFEQQTSKVEIDHLCQDQNCHAHGLVDIGLYSIVKFIFLLIKHYLYRSRCKVLL